MAAEDKGVETVGPAFGVGIKECPKEHGQMSAQEVGERESQYPTLDHRFLSVSSLDQLRRKRFLWSLLMFLKDLLILSNQALLRIAHY